jgi:hypothetical protein
MGGGCAALLVMLLHSDDVDVAAAVQRGVRSSSGSGLEEAAGNADTVLDRVRATVRQSKCFAIAAPCLCTLQLATSAEEHVTTVVAGKDVVCRLSVANVQHLVTKLNAATPLQPVLRLVQQVLGGNGGRGGRDGDGSHAESTLTAAARTHLPPPSPAVSGDDDRDGEVVTVAETTTAVSSAMHMHMHSGARRPSRSVEAATTSDAWGAEADESRDQNAPGFLVPPGRVIHLRHLTSRDGPPTAEFCHPSRFTEIAISIRLLADHMPKTYLMALESLLAAPTQEEERAIHTAEQGTESPHLVLVDEAIHNPTAVRRCRSKPVPVERAEASPDTQHMECSPPSSPSLPMLTTLYL